MKGLEVRKYAEMTPAEWDAAVTRIPDYTFNYLWDRIAFDTAFSPYFEANGSFMVWQGDHPMAAVPLYLEQREGIRQISLSWGYQWAPCFRTDLAYREQERLLEAVFAHLRAYAAANRCAAVKLRVDPMANPEMLRMMLNHNYLLEYGYEDHSILSRMVDLRVEEEVLLKSFRSNHSRCVRKAYRHYHFEVFDAGSITEANFADFPIIYEAAAGFLPHSMKFTEHYLKWIRSGHAVLVFAVHQEKRVGAILSMFANGRAYYGFGAELPGAGEAVSIGHALQFEAMRYFKAAGVHFYELGWQQYGELPYDHPTAKDLDISYFKRGFGGYNVPLYRGHQNMEVAIDAVG